MIPPTDFHLPLDSSIYSDTNLTGFRCIVTKQLQFNLPQVSMQRDRLSVKPYGKTLHG